MIDYKYMTDRVKTKYNLLNIGYKDLYDRWKQSEFNDDRRLYCVLYDELIESLEEMNNIENLFIWVAYNDRYSQVVENMNRIRTHFCSK